MSREGQPDLQLVVVNWGTAYGAGEVNRLYRAARLLSSVPFRFVCITDGGDDGYDAGIERVPFPEFVSPSRDLSRGCRLKLSIFKQGILAPDVTAIYFDLDTALLGDPYLLTEQHRRRPALYMLPNALVPLWRAQKTIRPLIGDRYYFGNSSILVFRPGDFHFLFDAFNAALATATAPLPKWLRSDERFISYGCRDRLGVLSNRVAVKFTEEFMAPFAMWEDLRRHIPTVANRRRRLVAVTFNGPELKREKLLALRAGDLITSKYLRVRWRHEEYAAYWS